MGLLDDAIREHLELKRKRGGDFSEIERQEHEALGPVRRTDDHAEEPEAATPPAGDPAMAPAEPVAEDPVVFEELEDESFEEYEPEPSLEAEESVEPELPAEEPAPEPEPVADAAPLPDHLAQPTVEFSVEEHLAEPEPEPEPEPESDPDVVIPDDEAEDVLEETPDFLQETPEHDRLWFEQKPPRDFDFDG